MTINDLHSKQFTTNTAAKFFSDLFVIQINSQKVNQSSWWRRRRKKKNENCGQLSLFRVCCQDWNASFGLFLLYFCCIKCHSNVWTIWTMDMYQSTKKKNASSAFSNQHQHMYIEYYTKCHINFVSTSLHFNVDSTSSLAAFYLVLYLANRWISIRMAFYGIVSIYSHGDCCLRPWD